MGFKNSFSGAPPRRAATTEPTSETGFYDWIAGRMASALGYMLTGASKAIRGFPEDPSPYNNTVVSALNISTKERWATDDDKVRKLWRERHDTINVLDVLWCQVDLECFHVGQQLRDFASTDDGEHIRRFLHEICDCYCDADERTANGIRSEYEPAWMFFAPTSAATFSDASVTCFSVGVRS